MAVATQPAVVPFAPLHFYKCQHCDKRMTRSDSFEEYQHDGCGGLVKLDPPPPPTALDDAKQFLERHPWATTDVDNPVELLAALVAEVDVEDDDDEEAEEPSDASKRVEALLDFVRGLRAQAKISDYEYRNALALVAD